MKRQTLTIAGAIFLTLVMALPAMAQQGQMQGQDQQQMQLSGTIIKEKKVDLKGEDKQNQAVLLQTEQGERIIADLGDIRNLEQISIEHGKQLQLQGKMVRVNNRPVFLASQVTADGQTVQVQHPEIAQRTRQSDMATLGKQQEVTGKIKSEKNVAVSGQDQEYKVVLLELDSGEQVVADLGPADQLNMDLKKGEQVDIQGNLAQVGDQLVLMASSVSAQGQQAQVQRQQQQQQQQ